MDLKATETRWSSAQSYKPLSKTIKIAISLLCISFVIWYLVFRHITVFYMIVHFLSTVLFKINLPIFPTFLDYKPHVPH